MESACAARACSCQGDRLVPLLLLLRARSCERERESNVERLATSLTKVSRDRGPSRGAYTDQAGTASCSRWLHPYRPTHPLSPLVANLRAHTGAKASRPALHFALDSPRSPVVTDRSDALEHGTQDRIERYPERCAAGSLSVLTPNNLRPTSISSTSSARRRRVSNNLPPARAGQQAAPLTRAVQELQAVRPGPARRTSPPRRTTTQSSGRRSRRKTRSGRGTTSHRRPRSPS